VCRIRARLSVQRSTTSDVNACHRAKFIIVLRTALDGATIMRKCRARHVLCSSSAPMWRWLKYARSAVLTFRTGCRSTPPKHQRFKFRRHQLARTVQTVMSALRPHRDDIGCDVSNHGIKFKTSKAHCVLHESSQKDSPTHLYQDDLQPKGVYTPSQYLETKEIPSVQGYQAPLVLSSLARSLQRNVLVHVSRAWQSPHLSAMETASHLIDCAPTTRNFRKVIAITDGQLTET